MAASPEVDPTPTSVDAPNTTAAERPTLNRGPSLCMKPQLAAVSPPQSATSPQGSLTSREWIIPPRPKPGRKPAVDVPPTKRKAQNRAAQRAFRERRAARVGELEEQVKLIEEEHEQRQDVLKDEVTRLERELSQHKADLARWMERCDRLEAELVDYRQGRANRQQAPSLWSSNRHETAQGDPRSPNDDEEAVGCGNCTVESRCQCIDDVVNVMDGEGTADANNSSSETEEKMDLSRSNSSKVKAEPPDCMEIDFTPIYSRPAIAVAHREQTSPSAAVADPCGFCQDGTTCICAEMAAEQERAAAAVNDPPSGSRLGFTPRRLAQFTPPPSEGDVTSTNGSGTMGWASGPGSCAQCRADPNSTLFCKSLAASRAQLGSRSTPVGCCGDKDANGSCCQSSRPALARPSTSTVGLNGRVRLPVPVPKPTVTLTCADAYTTLSRHPAYERASGEIASWLPKLHANLAGVEGRPAMEIDAANVMAVLRDFDRRFGATC